MASRIFLKEGVDEEKALKILRMGHNLGKKIGWKKVAEILVATNMDKVWFKRTHSRIGNRRKRIKRTTRLAQFAYLDLFYEYFEKREV